MALCIGAMVSCSMMVATRHASLAWTIVAICELVLSAALRGLGVRFRGAQRARFHLWLRGEMGRLASDADRAELARRQLEDDEDAARDENVRKIPVQARRV